MRALRLATVAMSLIIVPLYTPIANAQILDTGSGVCRLCGHTETDTQRYVNSFLNQMFFPRSGPTRGFIIANLYLLSGTFTMHGSRSPDPNFSSVTIAITAEVKGALPTGNYRVVVTTPGGQTSTKLYAIGNTRFVVTGNLDFEKDSKPDPRIGQGSGGESGRSSGGVQIPFRDTRPARCSRTRRVDRGNETIVYCSAS